MTNANKYRIFIFHLKRAKVNWRRNDLVQPGINNNIIISTLKTVLPAATRAREC